MSEGKDTPRQLDLYNRLSGNLRRILETIGLYRVARPIDAIDGILTRVAKRRGAGAP